MNPVGMLGLLSLPLSGIECACTLRYLQDSRRTLFNNRLALEERIRAGEDKDGAIYAALRLLESDISVLDIVIARLWELCPPKFPSGPDPPMSPPDAPTS